MARIWSTFAGSAVRSKPSSSTSLSSKGNTALAELEGNKKSKAKAKAKAKGKAAGSQSKPQSKKGILKKPAAVESLQSYAGRLAAYNKLLVRSGNASDVVSAVAGRQAAPV